jgi:hypothetical protein
MILSNGIVHALIACYGIGGNMNIQNFREISLDKKIIPAIAVNSMIIGSRNFEEAFELAAFAEDKMGLSSFVDLRSCRNPSTDNDRIWAGAHDNSSFDITNEECLERAVSFSSKYRKSIIGISVYQELFRQQDFEYGKEVIEKAIKLTPAAPDKTLIVRIVGGSKKSVTGEKCKKVVISNLVKLAKHACKIEKSYKKETGLDSKIILGLEIHQGQYPENIEEVVEIYKTLRNASERILDHIGIIEDPANRFISMSERYLPPELAASIINAAGGKIIYYHLKNVKFIDKWDGYKNKHFWMQGFQQVGNGRLFEFNSKIFEWRLPCEGDIDLGDCMNAGLKYSSPPHGIIGFSTEHIPASENKEEAQDLILKYGEVFRRTFARKQMVIGVEAK